MSRATKPQPESDLNNISKFSFFNVRAGYLYRLIVSLVHALTPSKVASFQSILAARQISLSSPQYASARAEHQGSARVNR